jgi:GT2 family glycosyltransferase
MLSPNVAFTICVLTYNRVDLLRRLLEELSQIEYGPFEIIVVDNHSEDETERMVINEFPTVVYIRTERNLGAAARNLGMRAARGEIIITLDDDVRGVSGKDLECLSQMFLGDPSLGALNFRVLNENGRTCNWVHHCKEEYYSDREFLTYEITEGAVAFRKSALVCSGYYAEEFFLSHEGPDLAFRIFENGYAVRYTGSVRVEHLFSEDGRGSWRNYYYDTRNQLWLAARQFPFYYTIVYLGRGLISMLAYSVRDGYFRFWVRAMLDGFRGLKSAVRQRHVLSRRTMAILREIDDKRPSLTYLLRKRLFKKGSLLFK